MGGEIAWHRAGWGGLGSPQTPSQSPPTRLSSLRQRGQEASGRCVCREVGGRPAAPTALSGPWHLSLWTFSGTAAVCVAGALPYSISYKHLNSSEAGWGRFLIPCLLMRTEAPDRT